MQKNQKNPTISDFFFGFPTFFFGFPTKSDEIRRRVFTATDPQRPLTVQKRSHNQNPWSKTKKLYSTPRRFVQPKIDYV